MSVKTVTTRQNHLTILKELVQLKDILNASQKQWSPLVNFFGLDVEYSSRAGGSSASSLFHDHGHGCAFIQESEFAIGIRPCGRITINSTIDQNVVKVGHQCANVSSRRPVYICGGMSVNSVIEYYNRPTSVL